MKVTVTARKALEFSGFRYAVTVTYVEFLQSSSNGGLQMRPFARVHDDPSMGGDLLPQMICCCPVSLVAGNLPLLHERDHFRRRGGHDRLDLSR